MDNDIVYKDEKKRLLTAPVLVPDRPDCDACRGEEPLTAEKIERMAYSYMENYRIVDKLHDYHTTKQNVAYPVASWILEEPATYKNIRGDTVQLPEGTWMATVKVADDQTWSKIESGEYNGFSVTALSNSVAELMAGKERVLIKDLEDPVGYTISIVPEPCVHEAIFCSIKEYENDQSDKAGRKISNATLNKIKGAFESLQNLINDALTERGQIEADKEIILEDVSMNEDELKTMIVEAVKEALQPTEPEPEPEEVVEVVEEEPEPEVDEEVEPEPEEEEEEPEPESSVAEKQLEEAQKRIAELEKKLGEGESQSIKGQDDTPDPVDHEAIKYHVEEGRDIYGRKL